MANGLIKARSSLIWVFWYCTRLRDGFNPLCFVSGSLGGHYPQSPYRLPLGKFRRVYHYIHIQGCRDFWTPLDRTYEKKIHFVFGDRPSGVRCRNLSARKKGILFSKCNGGQASTAWNSLLAVLSSAPAGGTGYNDETFDADRLFVAGNFAGNYFLYVAHCCVVILGFLTLPRRAVAGTCGVDGKRRVLVLSVSGCCHVWVPSGALPTTGSLGGGGDVLDLDRCAPHFRLPPFSAYLTFMECEEKARGVCVFSLVLPNCFPGCSDFPLTELPVPPTMGTKIADPTILLHVALPSLS